MWYVVENKDGYWLTRHPGEKDKIVFQSESESEAERRLHLENHRCG